MGGVTKVPQQPYAVDNVLAETGTVLFHELDLWAPERNNPMDKPEKYNTHLYRQGNEGHEFTVLTDDKRFHVG